MYFDRSFEYSMWMNEVCMMLADHSISDCTNESLGYHKIVGSEFETLVKSLNLSKNSQGGTAYCRRSYYRFDGTERDVIGCISSLDDKLGGFDVTVFSAPPKKKMLKQVLQFNDLRSPFTARLALGILFEAFAHNDFNIEQFESEKFAATINSRNGSGHIVGLYHTFDNHYHFAVTFDVIDNRAAYDTYYFEKCRGGYEMIGEDMDFPTLLSALGSLTGATEGINCDAEFDDEDNDFGYYGDSAYEL